MRYESHNFIALLPESTKYDYWPIDPRRVVIIFLFDEMLSQSKKAAKRF